MSTPNGLQQTVRGKGADDSPSYSDNTKSKNSHLTFRHGESVPLVRVIGAVVVRLIDLIHGIFEDDDERRQRNEESVQTEQPQYPEGNRKMLLVTSPS